jgi:hypothetical protein
MKKILIVSYHPVDETGSMTLWTRDKVLEFSKLGFYIDLISSPTIQSKEFKNVKIHYVHSINPSRYFFEIKSGRMFKGLFILPIVLSFGIIHELIERLILKRTGQGYWGWTIPSLLKIILLAPKSKYDLILSLGGPASSHLATAIASKIFRINTVIEFQDPIVGEDIGFNSRSASYFKYLERFLVTSCSKVVFVTKNAAEECQSRYPLLNNIQYTYSSSSFSIITNKSLTIKRRNYHTLKMAYFGELYSTRNYNSLFLAISKINKLDSNFSIEIDHYGREAVNNLDELNNNLRLTVKGSFSRDVAMTKALKYDVVLLIQHTDERSKLTIPYKTWDYLNIQKPILALLNNDELRELLDGLGHYTCDVNDVDSIVAAILRFNEDFKKNRINIKPNPYDISKQLLELISL